MIKIIFIVGNEENNNLILFLLIDIFAAPHYPSFGMEHSGLIIQFYHRILYQKDGDYEVYNKEWILYTTAHEIAHQVSYQIEKKC